jgi:hypothetical protein
VRRRGGEETRRRGEERRRVGEQRRRGCAGERRIRDEIVRR